jgi:hypothetical protein
MNTECSQGEIMQQYLMWPVLRVYTYYFISSFFKPHRGYTSMLCPFYRQYNEVHVALVIS